MALPPSEPARPAPVSRRQADRSVGSIWALGAGLVILVLVAVVVVWGLDEPDPDPLAGDPRVAASGDVASPTKSPVASPTKSPVAGPSTSPSTGSALGSWPGPDNTGVPAGTVLTRYTGPCLITANNTVIDAKTVNCSLRIHAANVVIRRSKINGSIYNEEDPRYSFRLEDSEVDAGKQQNAAVWHINFTILRANIYGGATSVSCVSNCVVRDSWLHGQYLPPDKDWHLGGFLSNGGDNASVVHNTIACDRAQNSAGGGCSGNINLFGDFGPVTNYTIDSNLFVANEDISYCVYGGHNPSKPHKPANIVFRNNVFQRGATKKCGYWGATSDFDPAGPGFVWSNNTWDDGSIVPTPTS